MIVFFSMDVLPSGKAYRHNTDRMSTANAHGRRRSPVVRCVTLEQTVRNTVRAVRGGA